MDWDVGRVSSMGMESASAVAARDAQDTSPMAIQRRLHDFLRNFRVGPIFFYREQLIANYRRNNYFFTVSLSHLATYDQFLQDLMLKNPKDHLPLLENAAKEMLAYLLVLNRSEQQTTTVDGVVSSEAVNVKNLPDIQAVISSDQAPAALRSVHAQEINRLVKVPGIVISATRVRTKCISATLRCKNCGNTKRVAVSGFGGVNIPRMCDRNREEEQGGELCPKDSYIVLPDRGDYVDQQTLKLQENPEVVPTGEMPRNLALIADRHLVDKASPGTRVSVVGITSVVNAGAKQVGAVAIRTLYIRVVGIEVRLHVVFALCVVLLEKLTDVLIVMMTVPIDRRRGRWACESHVLARRGRKVPRNGARPRSLREALVQHRAVHLRRLHDEHQEGDRVFARGWLSQASPGRNDCKWTLLTTENGWLCFVHH